MEINKLRIYCKVVELNSITKASEELYLAQPYVSRVLTELENELGYELFDRYKGKRTTANRHGIALFTHANNIINEVQLIPSVLAEINSQSGHIMLTTDLPVPGLEHALTAFKDRFPGIRVHFSTPDTAGNPFGSNSNVYITTTTKFNSRNRLNFTHLYLEKFVAVLAQNFPEVSELLDLRKCAFVLPNAVPGDRTFAEGILAQAGLSVPIVVETADTQHMLSLIAADYTNSNCALWPESRLRNAKLDGVKIIELQDVHTTRWINLLWPTDLPPTDATHDFVSFVRTYFASNA